jgi:hypothetical protein
MDARAGPHDYPTPENPVKLYRPQTPGPQMCAWDTRTHDLNFNVQFYVFSFSRVWQD